MKFKLSRRERKANRIACNKWRKKHRAAYNAYIRRYKARRGKK